MDGWMQLCARLPQPLAGALCALEQSDAARLEELRVYGCGQAELVIGGLRRALCISVRMEDMLCALSAHALYSCEQQLSQGYIPLPGGHRAGVCGRMTRQQDGTLRMADVSSVCIRIAHHVPQADKPIRSWLLDETGAARRVLLLGAPGCGKTTALRGAALYLAQIGLHVAVADEREELFAGEREALPPGLDVLGGLDKASAFSMLVRSMAPQVLVADEIGRESDVEAVLDAVRCGVGLLISAHARSMDDARRRPAIREMMLQEAFDSYILLGRHACVCGVYDRQGNEETGWEERMGGHLGWSGDGDDCCQRRGLSAFGW